MGLGREVPVSRLVAHTKVCKISGRYQKVIANCDGELKELERSLANGEHRDIGSLAAVSEPLGCCALTTGFISLHEVSGLMNLERFTDVSALDRSWHRCWKPLNMTGVLSWHNKVRAKSENVDQLEPILHAVEEKVRSLKGAFCTRSTP